MTLSVDDDSPVRQYWSAISQGAEARAYALDFCGLPVVAKFRFRKSYRPPALDLRLRKERTVAEARVLARCSEMGVPVPAVAAVDIARYTLYLELVPGLTGKTYVDRFRRPAPMAVIAMLCAFGAAVACLHDSGTTHGDLTTSNVICRCRIDAPSDHAVDGVVLIDFGLATLRAAPEDMAVDLHVLERALAATHRDSDGLVAAVLGAYTAARGSRAAPILARLDAVRARGRKRECFG
mmetsp:Transcript_22757/g.68324  ORF Transcript_22757/g.68324 Transcript_22757/m.68324 type:complete len:237 (+) Transcript_22757:48-758(+)|eukprot:CAMPEP_0119270202 /NCGR_PEP_ID=MMETSP1329-20130426/7303_1 /TAXON_ID=114041 /ORGANISM="Genus nov. species nov., Strain RCC1024" /LENGTH=236 /DNA_ID=CAMNT_0007270213 /DNA_START=32 /DNA_END=742 /DNA_ORIENTATION=-